MRVLGDENSQQNSHKGDYHSRNYSSQNETDARFMLPMNIGVQFRTTFVMQRLHLGIGIITGLQRAQVLVQGQFDTLGRLPDPAKYAPRFHHQVPDAKGRHSNKAGEERAGLGCGRLVRQK